MDLFLAHFAPNTSFRNNPKLESPMKKYLPCHLKRSAVCSLSLAACFCAGISALLGAVAPAVAQNVFYDNFDTGVSSATWAPISGDYLLVGDNAHTYGGSAGAAKQVNADPFVYYMRAANGWSAGTVQPGRPVVADVKFYDDLTPYIAGQPYGGGLMLGSSSSLTDFYQLLVNNGTTVGGNGTDYLIRSKASGNVDSGVVRTQGWHDFQIEVLPYTGSNDVQYYIDGSLVGTLNRMNGDVPIDELRLGLSIKTPGLAFWYDNASVSVVPEPSSVALLLGFGGLALLGRRAVRFLASHR
jgi:hypothetical protein